MKKMSVAQKMRWVAGALYMLLAFYQVFAMHGYISFYPITGFSVAVLMSAMLIPIAAVYGIWLFSSRSILSGAARRATVAATVFCVGFELLTYNTQAGAFSATLLNTLGLQDKYSNMILLYVLIIVRVLLLVLAAFFATSSKKALDFMADEADPDGEAEPDDIQVVPAETVESVAAKLEQAESETEAETETGETVAEIEATVAEAEAEKAETESEKAEAEKATEKD